MREKFLHSKRETMSICTILHFLYHQLSYRSLVSCLRHTSINFVAFVFLWKGSKSNSIHLKCDWKSARKILLLSHRHVKYNITVDHQVSEVIFILCSRQIYPNFVCFPKIHFLANIDKVIYSMKLQRIWKFTGTIIWPSMQAIQKLLLKWR